MSGKWTVRRKHSHVLGRDVWMAANVEARTVIASSDWATVMDGIDEWERDLVPPVEWLEGPAAYEAAPPGTIVTNGKGRIFQRIAAHWYGPGKCHHLTVDELARARRVLRWEWDGDTDE